MNEKILTKIADSLDKLVQIEKARLEFQTNREFIFPKEKKDAAKPKTKTKAQSVSA